MLYLLGSDRTTSLATDNDANFMHYTELGWECTVGRLWLVHNLCQGKIGPSDEVVTLKDRMFMYSKLCKVRAFSPDLQGFAVSPFDYGTFLSDLHVANGVFVPWRWPEEIPKILDFDFEPVDPTPCIVINHRVRNHSADRNFSKEQTRDLVTVAISLGLKPYICGRYAESVDARAEYIPRLQTVASLIHHPNCRAFVASGGPSLMAQQCCRNKLVFINTCGNLNNFHPLYLSPYLNFSGCRTIVVPPNHPPAVTEAILAD